MSTKGFRRDDEVRASYTTAPKLTACKGCGQSCRWIKTIKDKWMLCEQELLDYDDCMDGDKLVTEDGVLIHVESHISKPGVQGYLVHWITCPNADEFRELKRN